MTITKEELNKILEEHSLWLRHGDEKRADLHEADLREANLYRADLRGAILYGADLCSVNLCGADLCNTDLRGADLCSADLRNADLCNANLRNADLCNTDLRGADLCSADLRGADLRNANLRNADLRGVTLYGADLRNANLRGAVLYRADLCNAKNVPFIPMACPDTGSFIAWKKASKYIIKLQIPEDAKRSSATRRKCRANKAIVLAIENLNGTPAKLKEIGSDYDQSFIYKIGETVSVDNFCENRFEECAPGIHFFINREEAVQY